LIQGEKYQGEKACDKRQHNVNDDDDDDDDNNNNNNNNECITLQGRRGVACYTEISLT
jgi:hypothetical protein